jgi:hypothetical protein
VCASLAKYTIKVQVGHSGGKIRNFDIAKGEFEREKN